MCGCIGGGFLILFLISAGIAYPWFGVTILAGILFSQLFPKNAPQNDPSAAAAKENKEKNRHSAPLAYDPNSGSEAVILTLILNEEAARAQAQAQEHAPASPDTDAAADTAEGSSYDGDSGSSDGGDSGNFFDFGGWGDGGDGGD